MFRSLPFAISVAIAAWTLAAPAGAQPDDPSDTAPTPEEDFARWMEQGIALREASRDEDALGLFHQAYEVSQSLQALAQIALAEAALGRWVDAEAHLRQTLATPGADPWVDQRRTVLEQELQRFDARLGRLTVLSSVPGATLRVNGRDIGALPHEEPVRVLPGTVLVEVEADGHHPLQRQVFVSAGSLARESVRLVPIPTVVDTPDPDPDPAPDPDVVVVPDPVVADPPTPDRSVLPALGGVAVGLGLLSGVVSFVTFRLRESHVETFNGDACISTEQSRIQLCADEHAAAQRNERASVATLVLGGAMTVAGALLIVLGVRANQDADEQAGAFCAPGPGDVGLRCGARF